MKRIRKCDILNFTQEIRRALPDVTIHHDKPENRNGSHWLDLAFGDHKTTVQIYPLQGFGFFAKGAEGYGEGPEKVIENQDEALKEVLKRLK